MGKKVLDTVNVKSKTHSEEMQKGCKHRKPTIVPDTSVKNGKKVLPTTSVNSKTHSEDMQKRRKQRKQETVTLTSVKDMSFQEPPLLIKMPPDVSFGKPIVKTWAEYRYVRNKSEAFANNLLDNGVLPDQEELDFVIASLGKKSQLARRICAAICAYLTRTYESIVASSAAYRYEDKCEDKRMSEAKCIVFILLKKDNSEINCLKYRTYERCYKISPLSEETNRTILEFERKYSLSSGQLGKLMKFVQHRSSSLLKQHSNLTMVSASWCKSRGSGTESVLSFIPCIALYVHIKGLVPFDEEPFETTLGDYSVDVREGVFTPFCGANDHHINLKMGCAITGGQTTENGKYVGGTLGAFVKVADDDKVFAITSAHVVLDHSNLKQVIENKNMNYREIKPEVFHPVQAPLNSFGHIVFATHSQGVNGKSGMEIAVIQMNPDRCPLDGSFPDAPNHLDIGFDPSNPFSFKSGKCCDISQLHQSPIVMKYGSTTTLTEGKVRVHGSTVKTSILAEKVLDRTLILNNQIEIQSLGDDCFAEPGDSGALVLTRTEEGLVAVGIFEGIFNNVFIVTPMKAILEDLSGKLGLCQLLSFDHLDCASAPSIREIKNLLNETETNIEEKIVQSENRIQTYMQDKFGRLETSIQDSISRIEQTVERQLQSHNGDR